QADPTLDVGGVFVGAGQERAVGVVAGTAEGAVAAGKPVLSEEGRIPAVFAGHVEAKPPIDLVANAQTKERRALDVVMEDVEVVELEKLRVDAVDVRIGGADEALEVPGAVATHARRGWRRRRKAKIGGGGTCRLAQDQGKRDND